MTTIRIALFLIILGLVLSSCNDDIQQNSYLDDELRAALDMASNGEGMSYFLLPSSSDLASIPQDPRNPLTPEKVELGKLLFHETAFGNENVFPITFQEYSCASCHHAGAGFQAGIAQGIGEGGEGFGLKGEARIKNELCDSHLVDVQPIRSPSAMNGAFQELMLWNGQFGATGMNEGTEAQWTEGTPKETNLLGFEGLETQAIAGITVHRMGFTEESIMENNYKSLFDAAFPEMSKDERYTKVTAGLAIAAYERTVMSNQAPFQKYLRGNSFAMSDWEKEGAILFFTKAECGSCHTGPALNSMTFHAYGMNEFNPAEVFFFTGEDAAKLGRYSFTLKEEDKYKFKTPQLYNLRDAGFLGHGSSFHSIEEVIRYKNAGVPENNEVDQSYLSDYFKPLNLSEEEVDRLVAFIDNALYDPNLSRFVPNHLPSGLCFPNADDQSMIDLGCQ